MTSLRRLCVLALVLAAGCQNESSFRERLAARMPDVGRPSLSKFKLRSQAPDDEDEEGAKGFETKLDTNFVGEYTTVTGVNMIQLHGVGLVTGLDNTGCDPRPSFYRKQMLEDMRRRGVRNPNAILASPTTALVVVRAYLPPLADKGDRFDVEVRAVPGDDVKSLNGGWLMEMDLSEQALVPGQGLLEGHILAKAIGPVLVSVTESGEDARSALLQRGRVLGGGVSLEDRTMALYLRNDFRSVRNAKRIADQIGARFYAYNRYGSREPLAEAKTDQKIELKLLPLYKDNYPRYLQVVRSIAFSESDVARRVRMQRLREELAEPDTSERAALQLEAIGKDAVPILKTGLRNAFLEVRFHSATALAYLNDTEGLPALAEAAKTEPAFRVFSFAALSTLDDGENMLMLQKLMDQDSAETRYGAFRAMSTLNSEEGFIRGEKINDEFMLHELTTQGPPMIHLTTWRTAEVVLFGEGQEFRPPVAVRAGPHILVTATGGSDHVTVSRYQVGKPERREIVPLKIADVIRSVARLGASYPDIAQMLVQAERQESLATVVEIDALPKAGRTYHRPTEAQVAGRRDKTRVGSAQMIPNLYSSFSEDGDTESSKSEKSSRSSSSEEDADDTDVEKDEPETDADDGSQRKAGAASRPGRRMRKSRQSGSDADGDPTDQAADSDRTVSAEDFDSDSEPEESQSSRGGWVDRLKFWNQFSKPVGEQQEPEPLSNQLEPAGDTK